MNSIRRVALGTVFVLGLSAAAASAATTASQLVELSRAGLDDEILIALIQTDGSTFQLTAADILSLHKQGLSDGVIRAMQDTARAPAPAVEPEPASVIPAAPEPVPVVPAPPAVVNVYQTVTPRPDPPQQFPASYAIPIAVPVYLTVPAARDRRPEPPVYWGWGGQRRPDTWQPDPDAHREPAQPATTRNKNGN